MDYCKNGKKQLGLESSESWSKEHTVMDYQAKNTNGTRCARIST